MGIQWRLLTRFQPKACLDSNIIALPSHQLPKPTDSARPF